MEQAARPEEELQHRLQHLVHEMLAVLARLGITATATDTAAANAPAVDATPEPPVLLLSKRMRQFLRLLCHPKGYYYKEIAEIMACHPSTLRTYRERIAKRYGITGKTALVAWAFANGLG